uniref:putative potassium transporter 12 isoform X2 n=1 Tax=Erigeron canadensis TaxID=72917 RepID=UPI001CB8D90F|nr:putative potassium transporter 12 isoform X2 [Erigeron canadensis]
MEEDGIEEISSNSSSISARLLRRRSGGGDSGSRWVDGSEVDSESPPDDENRSDGYGSLRRRLVKKAKRVDSFDVEAMAISGAHGPHNKEVSIWQTLGLAFQTLGVVYGDMGTSPLYVFTDVFAKVKIESDVDVLGALSLVIYTIALVPLAKYVFIVLKANDNGEGGTFALYSLICRYAKINLLPNHQQADERISSFRLKLPTPELERALKIKEKLEHNSFYKTLLLLLVLMGTSMIIGDGILTPAISVMSAVSGLEGAEAMFADLGHFSVPAIQIAFSFVVFPCLLLAYMGQAAYLMKYPDSASRIFYDSIPDGLFWPVFLVATLAAVIASQAMISASFSCIKQSMALGCFPRLKIIHTSRKFMGQIYIPVINWFLMIMCVLVVATFQSTTDIANAYGIAEVGVMMVSTTLVTLVMLLIWQTNVLIALSFLIFFGSIELLYMSAVLSKITEGGWLPLAFASFFLCVMYIWNYGSVLKYQSEVRSKISMDFMNDLGSTLGTVRVPGIGLLYNELVHGVPSVLGQFLLDLPAIHSTLVFVCIKYVPVPVVSQEERFLFRRICPKDYHMFQCVARYGYKDVRKEDHRAFEQLLVESLEKFMRKEAQELALESGIDDLDFDSVSVGQRSYSGELSVPLIQPDDEPVLPSSVMGPIDEDPSLEYELSALREATESGFTYLLGHGSVRAKKDSFFLKKLVINYFYSFLRNNCRGGAATMKVPHMNIIQVGMTYMV